MRRLGAADPGSRTVDAQSLRLSRATENSGWQAPVPNPIVAKRGPGHERTNEPTTAVLPRGAGFFVSKAKVPAVQTSRSAPPTPPWAPAVVRLIGGQRRLLVENELPRSAAASVDTADRRLVRCLISTFGVDGVDQCGDFVSETNGPRMLDCEASPRTRVSHPSQHGVSGPLPPTPGKTWMASAARRVE